MANKIRTSSGITDCACVIHGTAYDWIYVERLYNMLERNLPSGIRMHVYTEHDRSVPPHMIKHCLEDLPIPSGPKKSWWHKLQMFNPTHHSGDLLYFDLDVIVLRDISWIVRHDTQHLWGCRDFRYLQNPVHQSLNSSVMWWNVEAFGWIWQQFASGNISQILAKYHGDQDFLTAVLTHRYLRYFDEKLIKSWRWQCKDGGYDFRTRKHISPGRGTEIDPDVAVMVFHGKPKPHEISDVAIQEFWR